jgi:hypothetical protein
MTDETTTITLEQDIDDATYSAADAANDIEEGQSEPAKEDDKTTENTEDSVIPPLPADEEAKEEEDSDDLPKLDTQAREAIGDNPEALEAWDRAWKGVTKREAKVKESEDRLAGFGNVEQALMDPSTAPAVLLEIAQASAKATGLTLEQLLGSDNSSTQTGDFAFDTDKKLYERAVADAEAKVMEKLGIDPKDLQGLVSERKQAAEAQRLDDWASKATGPISAKAAKEAGWSGITKQMVLEAAKENPKLISENPLLALKRTFPDEYAASQRTESKKLPEMPDGSSAKGYTIPTNPLEYTAAHAAMEVSQV